jgi:acyl-ACP thioesterase
VAGYHSEECGFGILKINQNNHSWVLSRLVIEMMEYPKHYEKILIQTWVESVIRTFSLRNFAFLNKDGKVLGYARTVWAMIDQETRKPLNLTQTPIPDFICDKECPIEKFGKIPFLDGETKETFIIKYSDIDINQHLNSSKYVEHILDAFSLHKFRKRDIHRFEIEFMAEGTFDETISLYKQENPDNEFLIELKNSNGQTLSKSKVKFGNK